MSRGPGQRQRRVLEALSEPCGYRELMTRLLGKDYTHACVAELSSTQRAIRQLRAHGAIREDIVVKESGLGPVECRILSVAKRGKVGNLTTLTQTVTP